MEHLVHYAPLLRHLSTFSPHPPSYTQASLQAAGTSQAGCPKWLGHHRAAVELGLISLTSCRSDLGPMGFCHEHERLPLRRSRASGCTWPPMASQRHKSLTTHPCAPLGSPLTPGSLVQHPDSLHAILTHLQQPHSPSSTTEPSPSVIFI